MGPRRIRAWAVCTLAVAAVLTLLLSSGGAAQPNMPQITLHQPQGGFHLGQTKVPGQAPKAPYSPPNNPVTLTFQGQLSCPSASCSGLATLVAPSLGPFTNVPLANTARIFSSQQPVGLTIGLSQRAVDLLFRYGDPRCTLVVSVVNNGSTAAADVKSGRAAATTVPAVAKKIPVTINVP